MCLHRLWYWSEENYFDRFQLSREYPSQKIGHKNMIDQLNNIHRENCVLRYSIQEFIEIEVWLLLTYTINWFLYILLSHIKEYRYFKNMIHQIDKK